MFKVGDIIKCWDGDFGIVIGTTDTRTKVRWRVLSRTQSWRQQDYEKIDNNTVHTDYKHNDLKECVLMNKKKTMFIYT